MDVGAYCDSLTIELTGWKAKVYDIIRRVDKLPSGDKKKVLPQVNDLHILLEELDDRIGRLKNQCPADWSPDKIELESKLTKISNVCEDCWKNISGGEVGG